ncbi:MAG: response regulator [Lachnospiraceae bacterium]|jgi:DNA-binding response OmpR family regulator|nr:response regulator [Lachnospiraceae bacterium]
MNTHKILLVEDDAEISEMLTNYLSMENYEVACAADGQDACNLFDNDTFSIVLLDLMIPQISGMEVMQYIGDCGYANTDGVVLYVGVNDDGCVVGIEGSNY